MTCAACGRENCPCDKNGQCNCGPDCVCTKKQTEPKPPSAPKRLARFDDLAAFARRAPTSN
ncbi:MAG TPA: hypothetical protein VHJ20_15680 [Polyangia bacterium]|nr:hypothetical protein [Polyangia bacterium]